MNEFRGEFLGTPYLIIDLKAEFLFLDKVLVRMARALAPGVEYHVT